MRKLDPKARRHQARLSLKRLVHAAGRKIRIAEKRRLKAGLIAKRRSFARSNGLFFDKDLARKPIVLPSVLSFADSYYETVSFLHALKNSVFDEGRRVLLHFEKVSRIDPSAALVLVSEIKRVWSLAGEEAVNGTYPISREVHNLLCQMGFFKLLGLPPSAAFGEPEAIESETNWLHVISDNRVQAALADRLIGLIEKYMMPLGEPVRGRLVSALVEAMTNTYDHAFPEPVGANVMRRRWWMSASFNFRQKEVCIMLFDHGVGIPKTLPPALAEQVIAAAKSVLRLSPSLTPSDGDLVFAATQIYRTQTGQEGRGRGFETMKQFVNQCGEGELKVLSNSGWYSYMPSGENHGSRKLSIEGTLIEWRFRGEARLDLGNE